MTRNALSHEVIAVIPAAGSGTRYGSGTNKPFLDLNGKPLIVWVLEVLESVHEIAYIIPVLRKADVTKGSQIFKEYGLTKISSIVEGGSARQDSVYNALRSIEEKPSIILIHDGVRPFLTKDMVQKALKELDGFEGVVLGVPPKDTIKETEQDLVQGTLDRSRLQAIQTPQLFPFEAISAAYEHAYHEGFYSTDDAALIERYGGTVKVIMGSYNNIKITTPEDLMYAEFLCTHKLFVRKKMQCKTDRAVP